MTQKDGKSTRVIATQMRQHREQRGFSAARLARAMTEAGIPWDRSIVANLENGRRAAVSIDELFALAYVLAVPPTLLLFPLGQRDEVEIVDGVAVHPDLARKWFEGQEPPMTSERLAVADLLPHWRTNSQPLWLYRELNDALENARQRRDALKGHQALVEFGSVVPEEVILNDREAYASALQALSSALRNTRDAGLSSPRLARDLVEDMTRLALEPPAHIEEEV